MFGMYTQYSARRQDGEMNARQAPISSGQDQVFKYVAAVMLQRFCDVTSCCTAVIPLP